MRLWSLKISEICEDLRRVVSARRSSPAQRQGGADLQVDATAADPMVDGRMFRGSDAWRLGILRKGACRPNP